MTTSTSGWGIVGRPSRATQGDGEIVVSVRLTHRVYEYLAEAFPDDPSVAATLVELATDAYEADTDDPGWRFP